MEISKVFSFSLFHPSSFRGMLEIFRAKRETLNIQRGGEGKGGGGGEESRSNLHFQFARFNFLNLAILTANVTLFNAIIRTLARITTGTKIPVWTRNFLTEQLLTIILFRVILFRSQ